MKGILKTSIDIDTLAVILFGEDVREKVKILGAKLDAAEDPGKVTMTFEIDSEIELIRQVNQENPMGKTVHCIPENIFLRMLKGGPYWCEFNVIQRLVELNKASN